MTVGKTEGGFMRLLVKRMWVILLLIPVLNGRTLAQRALTWQEVRANFEAANPSLKAGQLGIDEDRADEITAHLRPNPSLTVSVDQINPFTKQPSPSGASGTSYQPFAYALPYGSVSYLYERDHKRELRLESARKATAIAISQQSDLERSLLFDLRSAFVQVLQQKAVLELAKDNLAYYDHVLQVNRDRFRTGAIAKVDLDRLELQRVQYESDLQTADVGLRTAKIQLLMLLNDRTPVEQFDVTGPFDFSHQLPGIDDVRQIALDTRPDLKAALQSADKAITDHKLALANGSTDPTFSVDFARNPPIPVYLGVGVSIPLRVFDHNQGEKLRTQLDIERNRKLTDATRAQVFNDVDSAYATLNSTAVLLTPYKERYLKQAESVRDTIEFSYQRGAASLLDFLNAQADYRSVQVNYLNLLGSYLTAAAQLNLAVGREVIP
jgi:outer membrane protein, heavy metal efflux system